MPPYHWAAPSGRSCRPEHPPLYSGIYSFRGRWALLLPRPQQVLPLRLRELLLLWVLLRHPAPPDRCHPNPPLRRGFSFLSAFHGRLPYPPWFHLPFPPYGRLRSARQAAAHLPYPPAFPSYGMPRSLPWAANHPPYRLPYLRRFSPRDFPLPYRQRRSAQPLPYSAYRLRLL